MQTLHCHTTTSDGLLTYQQVLDICKREGIKAVVFTDHDAVPDAQKLIELEQLKSHSVKWIYGIEMSSGLPIEVGGGPYSGFHVVGLFVDPTYQPLVEYCQKAQASRRERMQTMVQNLQGLEFTITEADCLKASGGESVGRPHIVTALNYHSENNQVMGKLLNQMKKAGESDSGIRKEFENLMERGESQYPYVLFLSNEAFIKGVFVDYLYWLNFDECVKLIRDAGGVAVIAHYFSAKSKVLPELLEKICKEKRIDGLETVFGYFGYKTPMEEEIVSSRSICQNLVETYDLIASGGADAHQEQDLIDFAKASWYNQDTNRMMKKIVEKYPDLKSRIY